MPARPGAPGASTILNGPFGLAWRRQRGPLLGWTAAFALTGAAFGGIAGGIGGLLDSSPQIIELLRQLGGRGTLVDVFPAAEFGILGLLAAAYAISAALRLRTEGTTGRVEAVLGTAVGRGRWAASHLVVAVGGPALALGVAGPGAGVVRGAATGNVGREVAGLVAGALVQLPAVWVLVGVALALFGVLPRLVVGTWAVLVAFLLLGEFGALLRLPQWALDPSPFAHLPRTLAAGVDVTPLLWMVVIAAALGAVGLIGWRRRDVG